MLGGIKVGTNLSITTDGVLSANDNPTSYIVKQQRFTATAGQTAFTLTGGKYRPGIGALAVFLNGAKVSNEIVTETSQTVFTLKTGVDAGDTVLAEYVELINVEPYPVHASEHMTGGTDPIPVATQSAAGLESAADKKKLDGIAEGANKYVHPGSGTNPHGTTKSDVGLGNVPNVATNDQTPTYTEATTLAKLTSGEKLSVALGKISKAVTDLIAHIANKSNPHGVTKAQVGLGNVDNTSDANKPVSTAQQAALNSKLNTSLKGAANGLAELDSTGKVPAAQLPSLWMTCWKGITTAASFTRRIRIPQRSQVRPEKSMWIFRQIRHTAGQEVHLWLSQIQSLSVKRPQQHIEAIAERLHTITARVHTPGQMLLK
ncbi:hypothetical protein LC724_08055 [Blautia sp. RD014234]|nr:hypothetical protein [Blautia parvula]